MAGLQLSEFVGLPLRDIQVYLDVNHPGHRIFLYSILGNDKIQYRIVGPIFNLAFVQKRK